MNPKQFLSFLIILFLASVASSCSTETDSQTSNESADTTTGEATNEPVADYDCPFCGMPADQFPKWNTRLVSEKGEQWFDSPRCTFLYILDPETSPRNITTLEVTDYYETKKIPAREAFFVIGSNITGPMGKDLVPHATREAAEDFSKDHQGQQTLSYEEIDLETVKEAIQ